VVSRGATGRRRRTGGIIVALVAVALVAGGCQYLQALAVTPVMPVAPVPSGEAGIPAPSIGSNGPSDAPPSADPDDPGFSFDPDATDAPPKAYFKHGSATLTIGTQVIKLDKMVGQGFLSEQFGAQAAWTNGSGWYAQAFGISPAGSEYAEDALVSFDHIVNGQHWTVGDPSLCHIAVTRSDEKGLAGTATCPNLRWADLMAAYASPTGPVYIKGEPAFDAKLTFEASP
jgi:hypothetical protein